MVKRVYERERASFLRTSSYQPKSFTKKIKIKKTKYRQQHKIYCPCMWYGFRKFYFEAVKIVIFCSVLYFGYFFFLSCACAHRPLWHIQQKEKNSIKRCALSHSISSCIFFFSHFIYLYPFDRPPVRRGVYRRKIESHVLNAIKNVWGKWANDYESSQYYINSWIFELGEMQRKHVVSYRFR